MQNVEHTASPLINHNQHNSHVTNPFKPNAVQTRDALELRLIKVLLQHKDADGWIVLIAPSIKPDRAFWSACQLPINKVLMIHEQPNVDTVSVIQKAIMSEQCQVIIDCLLSDDKERKHLAHMSKQKNKHYYMLHTLIKHH